MLHLMIQMVSIPASQGCATDICVARFYAPTEHRICSFLMFSGILSFSNDSLYNQRARNCPEAGQDFQCLWCCLAACNARIRTKLAEAVARGIAASHVSDAQQDTLQISNSRIIERIKERKDFRERNVHTYRG